MVNSFVLNSINITLKKYSTFGVTGNQWRFAAKATCTTMVASFGGGLISLVMSYYQTSGKIDVLASVNGVLGALVGITGGYNTYH